MRGIASAEDLAPRLQKNSSGHEVEVAAVRIDETLASLEVDHVDVVKMDIEGAEMGALLGMEGILEESRALVIVLELNPAALRPFGVEPEALCTWLTERDFAVSRIADDGSIEKLAGDDAIRDLVVELDRAGDHANLLARRR